MAQCSSDPCGSWPLAKAAKTIHDMGNVEYFENQHLQLYGAELGSLTDDDICSRGATALTLEPAALSSEYEFVVFEWSPQL